MVPLREPTENAIRERAKANAPKLVWTVRANAASSMPASGGDRAGIMEA
jgi:hypothetical protein